MTKPCRSRGRGRAVFVVAAAATFIVPFGTGCRQEDGGTCESNSDCKAGLSCDYDRCSTCATSRACSQQAECSVDPMGSVKHGAGRKTGMFCLATEESCRQHRICKVEGKCNVDNKGHCVSAAEICAESYGCRVRGQCTPMPFDASSTTSCQAASNDDCKRSERCLNEGACLAENGACVKK